jgi:hypothetical protein
MNHRPDAPQPVRPVPTTVEPERPATGRRRTGILTRIPVPVRRMGIFALIPLLSTLSNVVLLPVVSSSFGQAGWTSVVLGQSIGAAASVVCSLQWPTEGPGMVARASAEERLAIMRASMRSRAATVLACVPVALLVIAIVQPAGVLVCTLSALSATLIGLSPAWFVVGIGRPTLLVWLEGIPRLVGNVIALALILGGLPLWTYPALMLATSAFTATLSWFRLAGGLRYRGPVWKNAQDGRSLRFATLARTLDAGYGFIAGPIVAVLAPAAYPVFGACDRLANVAFSGLVIVQQGAGGWVAEPESAEARVRRARMATLYLLPLALLVFAFLSLATPLLVHLLFSGTVSVGYLTSALTGAFVAAGFLGHALFLTGLAPTGNARHGYRYLSIAFAVGLPSLVVGTLVGGVDGALLGCLASGATLVVLSLARIWTSVSHDRETGPVLEHPGQGDAPGNDNSSPVPPGATTEPARPTTAGGARSDAENALVARADRDRQDLHADPAAGWHKEEPTA